MDKLISMRAGLGGSDGRAPKNLLLCHHPACEPLGERQVKNRGGSIQSGQARRHNRVYHPDKNPRSPFQAYGENGVETVKHWDCHPECEVKRLDDRTSGGIEDGTATRFFGQVDYLLERMEEADTLLYQPKASAGEREAGLADVEREDTEGEAADRKNIHPTLKPIALACELAKLLLPPPAYEPRLLIPFSGAGSEYVGAMFAGWEHIVGVELMPEYCQIAEARIAYWRQRGAGAAADYLQDVAHSVALVKALLRDVEKAKPAAPGQLSMFDEEAQ